jgi:hypothetical protein
MKRTILLVVLLLALLALTSLALAQGGVLAPLSSTSLRLGSGQALGKGSTGYKLSWWTVDGGGGSASGGPYTLAGAVGQPDAGPVFTGGDYALAGGFWYGAGPAAAPEMYIIYLPLVARNYP